MCRAMIERICGSLSVEGVPASTTSFARLLTKVTPYSPPTAEIQVPVETCVLNASMAGTYG